MDEDIRNLPFITVMERWTPTSGERKIGDGPWEPIDLSLYGGKTPFVFLQEKVRDA